MVKTVASAKLEYTNIMIYFSLTPHIYAARFDDAVIILDSSNDNYLSFIESAATCFQQALNNAFQRAQDGTLSPTSQSFNGNVKELNEWIKHFIENNLIIESTQEQRKLLAPLPITPGGLADYRWDHKPSWKPFASASKVQVIAAFIMLARIHRLLKKTGIKGVLDAIKTTSAKHTQLRQPTEQEIEQLAAAVDAASLLYPKKTFCLAWAATFVLLALKKGWSCNLAIGIQTNPFYAHAWAHSAGKVIHDDPVIAQVLSIILQEPHT